MREMMTDPLDTDGIRLPAPYGALYRLGGYVLANATDEGGDHPFPVATILGTGVIVATVMRAVMLAPEWAAAVLHHVENVGLGAAPIDGISNADCALALVHMFPVASEIPLDDVGLAT